MLQQAWYWARNLGYKHDFNLVSDLRDLTWPASPHTRPPRETNTQRVKTSDTDCNRNMGDILCKVVNSAWELAERFVTENSCHLNWYWRMSRYFSSEEYVLRWEGTAGKDQEPVYGIIMSTWNTWHMVGTGSCVSKNGQEKIQVVKDLTCHTEGAGI